PVDLSLSADDRILGATFGYCCINPRLVALRILEVEKIDRDHAAIVFAETPLVEEEFYSLLSGDPEMVAAFDTDIEIVLKILGNQRLATGRALGPKPFGNFHLFFRF